MTESWCPKCKRYFRSAPAPTICPLCQGKVESSGRQVNSSRCNERVLATEHLVRVSNHWGRP